MKNNRISVQKYLYRLVFEKPNSWIEFFAPGVILFALFIANTYLITIVYNYLAIYIIILKSSIFSNSIYFAQVLFNIIIALLGLGGANASALRIYRTFDTEMRKIASGDESHSIASEHSKPPAFAEIILMIITRKNLHASLMGDMEERFVSDCQKFGETRATRLYWAEVIRTIWPLVGKILRRVISIGLKKWLSL